MEITKHQENQLQAQRLTPAQHSKKLIQCFVRLESAETKSDAKMELVTITSDLMPAGSPSFLSVVKYPKITDLIAEYGKKTILKVVFLMVKDFCSSMNVVRNMNEDQQIEAASMLIDEAGNFRLEDYTMFFAMAKRGMLGKVMDRVDLEVISNFLDTYWIKRKKAAEQVIDSESKHLETLGNTLRIEDSANPMDLKLAKAGDGLLGAIGDLKNRFGEWKKETE